MPQVTFTRHLRVHFPDLVDQDVPGETVAELVRTMDERCPGLAAYLLDDRGALRRHVNIFVNEELLEDRRALSDPVTGTDRVFVMQALSGG
jgi:sulfur carrier protein ThiS